MNEPPSIRGTRIPATREQPPHKFYVYRGDDPPETPRKDKETE